MTKLTISLTSSSTQAEVENCAGRPSLQDIASKTTDGDDGERSELSVRLLGLEFFVYLVK